jgi:hypothetical protein
MSKYEDAAYVQDLEAKVEAFQAKIDQLQAENKQLRMEVSRLKGAPAVRDGLEFSAHNGVWWEAAQGYCTKCLDKEKRNPLKNESHGWRCMVCNWFYSDPDRPHDMTPRGGGDWMA